MLRHCFSRCWPFLLQHQVFPVGASVWIRGPGSDQKKLGLVTKIIAGL
jgi:hypothetical protein